MSHINLQSQPPFSYADFDTSAISLPPPASAKGHQRSRTAVDLPPIVSRSQSLSPVRNSSHTRFRASQSISLHRQNSDLSCSSSHIDVAPARQKPGAVSKLTSWFEGTSEPVNISLVPSTIRERSQSFYKVENPHDSAADSQEGFTHRLSKKMSISPSTTNSSMFSFFKKPVSQVQVKANPDDLVDMHIEDALLPDGPVKEFTPEAFAALQQHAEALLKRFQVSYTENLGALRQITSSKNVQADELEACQTKNEHLKMQLLEMAEKAADQEKSIVVLKDQIQKHQQSIRLITEDEPAVPQRLRRSRFSDCSSSGASITDSEMSSTMSIFSEVESICAPATSVAATPVFKDSLNRSPTVTVAPTHQAQVTAVLVPDCSNCHGVPASEAWDVIGILKMESQALKHRVSELESAQDAALDLLCGLQV